MTNAEQLFTKAGWRRYVREVAALEEAAADGNTWGPETDAAILAWLVIDGLRKDYRQLDNENHRGVSS